jgi:hypothetical protein
MNGWQTSHAVVQEKKRKFLAVADRKGVSEFQQHRFSGGGQSRFLGAQQRAVTLPQT